MDNRTRPLELIQKDYDETADMIVREFVHFKEIERLLGDLNSKLLVYAKEYQDTQDVKAGKKLEIVQHHPV